MSVTRQAIDALIDERKLLLAQLEAERRRPVPPRPTADGLDLSPEAGCARFRQLAEALKDATRTERRKP